MIGCVPGHAVQGGEDGGIDEVGKLEGVGVEVIVNNVELAGSGHFETLGDVHLLVENAVRWAFEKTALRVESLRARSLRLGPGVERIRAGYHELGGDFRAPSCEYGELMSAANEFLAEVVGDLLPWPVTLRRQGPGYGSQHRNPQRFFFLGHGIASIRFLQGSGNLEDRINRV